MTAPEQQAAPEQADLRQRLADALDNAHRTNPCTCGAIYYYACFHDGALSHTERRTAAVLAVVQPELAELAALREQHTATQAENARLRLLLAHDHHLAYHQGEPRDGHGQCGRESCQSTNPLYPPPVEPLPTEPGNAEDCPSCRELPNPPYPFLCPGHPAARPSA